jgi:hypothetical protein
MRKWIAALIMLGMTSSFAIASTLAEKQAGSFANIYASLCLEHLNNLGALREKLQSMPRLPPEKATHFLAGKAGDAWPVPDQHGTFVLALAADDDFCAVYGRKADTRFAKQQFAKLVGTAPAPLVAEEMASKLTETSANGTTQTASYEWSAPGARRKLLFMLTTAPSKMAQVQVMGSASLVSP